ncbi:MAG: PqqD family protein [Deltaproteobacteria bacterium]|nr:PqqD family protein [Deltaproteobacteria bacterium]MBW2138554.1 PqqD family protein [Deltaproteobacteria bacterium]
MTRTEALDCVPLKNPRIRESRLESGEVLLSYTVKVRPWFSGLVRRLGKEREIVQSKKIQLDELGTTVWDLIDGGRSVRAIVREFSEGYQLENKEAEVSVTSFLRELGKRGLVGLR